MRDWRRWRKRWVKDQLPKIDWKHDNWTINRICKRLHNPLQIRILLVLQHLHAGVPVKRITAILGESRTNIVGWAKRYKREGLQTLLGIDIAVPILFRKRIVRYVREHPNILGQLLRLETDDDFEMYGEEMDVEGYALKNWVYELELRGNDERKAVLDM